MPAPLFKRFVPPPSATAIEAYPPAAVPRKEKKSKKNKTAEVVAVPDEVEDVVMEDAPTPKPSKKSNKRKSEVVEEQEEQNEEVSNKHKAVLSKFEKASKLAEARKDETVEEVEEPEEELHGKCAHAKSALARLMVSRRPPAYATTCTRTGTRVRAHVLDTAFVARPANYRRSIENDAL